MAAYGGTQYQVTQQVLNGFAEAIQEARVDVVPRVVVGGGNGNGGADGSGVGSSIMEGLLTLLLSEKLGMQIEGGQPRERSTESERLRDEIRQSLMEKKYGKDQEESGAS